MFVVCCVLFDDSCFMMFAHGVRCCLFAACYLLCVVCCLLFVVCVLLFVSFSVLLVACCVLCVVCCLFVRRSMCAI